MAGTKGPGGPAGVYGSSTVKRVRRTRSALGELDEAIMEAARLENPCTLRSPFYRTMSAGAVEKTEDGYRAVGRQALKGGRFAADSWVTDGTRYVIRPTSWDDVDEMLDSAHRTYRRNLWIDQAVEIHVFSEKDDSSA